MYKNKYLSADENEFKYNTKYYKQYVLQKNTTEVRSKSYLLNIL
jgi:hypothetical protein